MQRDSAVSLWVMGFMLCSAGWALAQSGAGFEIRSSTVDAGGGTSSWAQGQYSISGTAGQPDAGWLTGGVYELTGGFWSAVAEAPSATPTRTTTPGGPTPTPGASPVPAGGGSPLPALLFALVGVVLLRLPPRGADGF